MDQSQLLSIFGGVYDKLVADVADAVIRKLKAEGTAIASLEPEFLAASMLILLESDTDIREEVRTINEQTFDEITSRLDHIENDDTGSLIDADNTDFDSAVMQVLRNNI